MSKGQKPTHSILPASGCERWWNCPGSVEAVKAYPNEESIYAAEGTVAHGLAADLLLGKLTKKTLEKKIGDTIMQGEFEIAVTEEMTDAVIDFFDLIQDELEEGVTMFVEEKVNLAKENKHLYGTADVVLIKPYEWIKVIDLKYGKGISVSAWQNKQLMCYLTYAWEGEDVGFGEVIISQPRLDGDKAVSRYQVTEKEYQEFRKDLLKKAKIAMKKKAERCAGAWCKKTFCPAFADCTEAHKEAHAIVSKDFDDPIAPENLPIDKIRTVLEKAEFLTAWLGAVKSRAKELMLNGTKIDGFKLVQGYGHRKWQAEEAVIADFEDKDIFEKPKLKSPSKLTKIIGKDAVEQYSYKPKTEIKLVPEDSKGEPLMLDRRSDFDDEEL